MKGPLSNINSETVARYLILTVFILLLISVTRTYFEFSGKENILQKARLKLEKVNEENENLKRQFARTQMNDFIEKEARNKLNLSKEGEIVIIMPAITSIPEPLPTKPDTSTNFQKWMRVFL